MLYVSVSSDSTYVMIYFEKPANYKLVHGQYVFLNVPCIHPFQWHPFTVASSPNNPYLVLMIKKAGDWTGKLIQELYERKKQLMMFNELKLDGFNEYDIFNMLHDLHQELPLEEAKARNCLFYPHIKISRACATPNDTFIGRKNIVLVGAGSGISPYLPLLEEVIRKDKGEKVKYDFESAKVIFVAREGEQISWVSNYLFHVLNSACISNHVEFNVFITLNKNDETLPSFLFWRAFTLLNLKREEEHNSSSLKICLGRPNFQKLIDQICSDSSCPKTYVYACGPEAMTDAVEKICLQKSDDKNHKIIFNYEVF